MKRPQADEYAAFYHNYIEAISDDILRVLEEQAESFPALIERLTEEQASFAYQPGKWTVKELAGHVIDTERIMVYRALRIGRHDVTPLAGFEENDYVRNAHFADRSIQSFADEFKLLRKANLFLLNSFTEEELNRAGTSNNSRVTVRALLFIIAGHVNHHKKILEERYL